MSATAAWPRVLQYVASKFDGKVHRASYPKKLGTARNLPSYVPAVARFTSSAPTCNNVCVAQSQCDGAAQLQTALSHAQEETDIYPT